jgi:glycosyltransferase involved in cell wall biosynthesis
MARLVFDAPLSGVPFVLDMVDVDSAKWAALAAATRQPVRAVYAREARMLAPFEARATRAAAATFVTTSAERVLLQRLAPDTPIEVMPNGIDSARFAQHGAPAAEPVVIFTGVMSYAPNRHAILWFARHVWPRVRAKRPDARLVVAGAEPPADVRQLSRIDGVTVTGSVPDIRPYLWRSAIAVAPLAIARGVQNKVLEAVAAGLPCVITPAVRVGLPEAVVPACRVAEDANGFADAVVDLLSLAPGDRRALASVDLTSLQWSVCLRPAVVRLSAPVLPPGGGSVSSVRR